MNPPVAYADGHRLDPDDPDAVYAYETCLVGGRLERRVVVCCRTRSAGGFVRPVPLDRVTIRPRKDTL